MSDKKLGQQLRELTSELFGELPQIPAVAYLRDDVCKTLDRIGDRLAYLESCARSLGCYRDDEWRPLRVHQCSTRNPEGVGMVEWRRAGVTRKGILMPPGPAHPGQTAPRWQGSDGMFEAIDGEDEWRPVQPDPPSPAEAEESETKS